MCSERHGGASLDHATLQVQRTWGTPNMICVLVFLFSFVFVPMQPASNALCESAGWEVPRREGYFLPLGRNEMKG